MFLSPLFLNLFVNYIHTVPTEARRACRSPRTGILDGFKLPCGCWELTLGHLEEPPVLYLLSCLSLRIYHFNGAGYMPSKITPRQESECILNSRGSVKWPVRPLQTAALGDCLTNTRSPLLTGVTHLLHKHGAWVWIPNSNITWWPMPVILVLGW